MVDSSITLCLTVTLQEFVLKDVLCHHLGHQGLGLSQSIPTVGFSLRQDLQQ
jgi:hypothetical protein